MSNLDYFVRHNRWPAPAKLNLCLYVVGKRPDGYHELETLFQLLDYGDVLSFELNAVGKIDRSYDLGFDQEVDLCLRAARLLKAETGVHQGVTIHLAKNLPMGGGLGGGSSDAATVLIALNHLWGTQLSIARLAELAVQLGADVPLFVRGRTAWGAGIGEQLTPYQFPQQKWLVVIPMAHISTAQIFSHNRLTARPQMKKIRALKMALEQNRFEYQSGENQLEPIVRSEFPAVDAVFEWFEARNHRGFAGGPKFFTGSPKLSGSGGAVFVPLASELDDHTSASILAELPEDARAFIAQGRNFHPLYTKCGLKL